MESENKKPRRGFLRIVLFAVGGFCIVVFLIQLATLALRDIGILPTLTPSVTPTLTPLPSATPEPSATPQPTATPVPTDTPIPTATPVPTATLEPLAQLEYDVRVPLLNPEIYEFNFDESTGVLSIRFMLRPNYGDSGSAINHIVKVVGPSGIEYTKLKIVELANLKDSFGNIEVTEVAWADFSAETLNQVQWENFADWEMLNLAALADRLEWHPDHP